MENVSDRARPVSSGPQTSAIVRAAVFFFFFVFFAVGTAFGIGVFGKPLLHMLAARQWRSAPCEIISSSVHANQASDGSTYRVDVTYRYFVDDRSYIGDRYQFMDCELYDRWTDGDVVNPDRSETSSREKQGRSGHRGDAR